jgi:phage-related minor tail protein
VTVNWGTSVKNGASVDVPSYSVKWFAGGGILDGAQLFGKLGNKLLGGGEAGKEAVLPLESNTGWMDRIAAKTAAMLAGNGNQPIQIHITSTLNGKVVAQDVIDYTNNVARTTGTHPMAAYI